MNEKMNESVSESQEDDSLQSILDHVLNCPVVFQSQQIGDPDLTKDEKKRISEHILINKPLEFLTKFGKFLNEHHLKVFLKKHEASVDVTYYVSKLMKSVDERGKNQLKRNRRYEAMKRMEANKNYFSDAEMEKREPLLYHQMVGQYLNVSEKEKKLKEAFEENACTSFSKFLLYKLEKEELLESLLAEEYEENNWNLNNQDKSNLTESSIRSSKDLTTNAKWGADWEDEENVCQMKNNNQNSKTQSQQEIKSEEKALLYEEFKSIMQNKFLNGQDNINYSDIDSNSDYDCIEIRAQDEEEKYFDEETSDNNYVCTDTGIEDY